MGGVGGTTCAEANEPTEQSAASTVARPTLEVPGRDGLIEFVSGFIICFGYCIFTILFCSELGLCRSELSKEKGKLPVEDLRLAVAQRERVASTTLRQADRGAGSLMSHEEKDRPFSRRRCRGMGLTGPSVQSSSSSISERSDSISSPSASGLTSVARSGPS